MSTIGLLINCTTSHCNTAGFDISIPILGMIKVVHTMAQRARAKNTSEGINW